MSSPASVASSLTEAQRNAVFFPNGYRDPNTHRALRRKKLAGPETDYELLDAVRAILRQRTANPPHSAPE